MTASPWSWCGEVLAPWQCLARVVRSTSGTMVGLPWAQLKHSSVPSSWWSSCWHSGWWSLSPNMMAPRQALLVSTRSRPAGGPAAPAVSSRAARWHCSSVALSSTPSTCGTARSSHAAPLPSSAFSSAAGETSQPHLVTCGRYRSSAWTSAGLRDRGAEVLSREEQRAVEHGGTPGATDDMTCRRRSSSKMRSSAACWSTTTSNCRPSPEWHTAGMNLELHCRSACMPPAKSTLDSSPGTSPRLARRPSPTCGTHPPGSTRAAAHQLESHGCAERLRRRLCGRWRCLLGASAGNSLPSTIISGWSDP
mmetsp:Transcript_36856/g.104010  ORF Transcript_36856/g.104010 Transcript_36856/m.104010 type:complete len:307 (-) Transcript_36856:2305-3225(-)